MHEERRPRVSRASDILGPGFAPQAVQVLDWNSTNLLYNGFFYSEPGAANAPEPDVHFLGINIATVDGHGIQVVWSHHEGVTRNYTREMHAHSNSIPAWAPWLCVSGTADQTITTAPLGQDYARTRAWYLDSGGFTVIATGEIGYFDSTCTEGVVKRHDGAAVRPNPLVCVTGAGPGQVGQFAEPGSVVPVLCAIPRVNIGDTLVTSIGYPGVNTDNAVTDPRYIVGVARTMKGSGVPGWAQVLVR
jgi:hypothetical protein